MQKAIDADETIKLIFLIKETLMKSQTLKTGARNNNEKDFEFAFYDDVKEALTEATDQNMELCAALLDDEDKMKEFFGIYVHETFLALKNDE